ncbi:Sulfotransferase [Hordeum vulgare]|nr:Sulfotransferase [Hordeum vulgare]
MPELKKQMDDIVAQWRADDHPVDVDAPMEDATEDDRALPSSTSSVMPPSSSVVAPSSVNCTMTIGEANAHYMDMVREECFWEAQADATYNHHLLQEHLLEEEELGTARRVAEVASMAKEDDEEEGVSSFGETDDEEEVHTEAAPNESGTSA